MTEKGNKSPKAKATTEEKRDNVEEEKEPVKVNKWDASAVKHAIDDSVKQALMQRPNCTENFSLVDGRLFICALAVAIALVALGWDFKHPFPESKPVLIICVGSYFILMGVLTLYTTYREKNIFAVAMQKDGSASKVWQASSDMKKYDDMYMLTLSVKDKKGEREANVTKSCTKYIDENGFVLNDLVANDVNRLYNNLNADKSK